MTKRTGWSAILFSSLAIAAAGCSPPLTDVIATSTEAVGAYDVVGIVDGDRGFTATVCVADARHADAVAERVVDQLIDHGYLNITLDLVAMSAPQGPAPVKQLIWTPGDGARESGTPPAASTSACGAARSATSHR